MRKKLDTRFPAARIKKIMQADEDVGKIAMAVPLLVSKALELFLQDLCDRTYEIKLQRGAKTLNSMHLKQCVQSCNVFDFLSDIVGKVPDLGGSEGAAVGEDRSATKRRKIADNEHNDGDEDLKRDKQLQPETHHVNRSGRGRGRGRGRGGGRISQAEREANAAAASNYEKYELFPNNTDRTKPSHDSIQDTDSKDSQSVKVRNFDLNLDLDENGDTQAISTRPVTPVVTPPRPTVEMKTDEYPGWSLEDVEKMAIDPIHLANLNSRVDEDEEDYDEEG